MEKAKGNFGASDHKSWNLKPGMLSYRELVANLIVQTSVHQQSQITFTLNDEGECGGRRRIGGVRESRGSRANDGVKQLKGKDFGCRRNMG